jgi:hypothetical protein
MEFFSNRIMPVLLLGIFVRTWALSGDGAGAPIENMLIFGGLISFPFFFVTFLQAVIGGKMVAGCLLIAGILFPPLLIFLSIWIILSIFAKFASLIENLPLLLGGLCLIGITWAVPSWLFELLASFGIGSVGAGIIIGLVGAGVFSGYLLAAKSQGYRPGITSALALGPVCYLLLFAITLLLPGHVDSGDASSDS